jgi:hypothetical protein
LWLVLRNLSSLYTSEVKSYMHEQVRNHERNARCFKKSLENARLVKSELVHTWLSQLGKTWPVTETIKTRDQHHQS